MKRELAPVPRIAFTAKEVAEALDYPYELLRGQIGIGRLRAKRTSFPTYVTSYGTAWGAGRYLIGAEDLAEWLIECRRAADAGLDRG